MLAASVRRFSRLAVLAGVASICALAPWAPALAQQSPQSPAVAGSTASSLVLKASPGSLLAVYANSTVSGYLMVFNAVSVPSNGSTTAGVAPGNMVECVGPGVSPYLNFSPGPLEAYSVGITAAFSSTGCGTLTLSATAFIHGLAK